MRRISPTAVTVLTLLLCASAAGGQQQALSELPGYFPFEELDILARDELSVEVNLSKPLLRLVAAATRKAEPEFAELLESLDAVRVRVAPSGDVDLERARAAVGKASRWLEDKGWQVVVRTREHGEEIFIYTRELDGEIAGMAVLVVDDAGDVAVINVVGKMDLDQLGKLSEALDIPLFSLDRPLTEEPTTDDDPP